MQRNLVRGAFTRIVEERATLPLSESEALELASQYANKQPVNDLSVCKFNPKNNLLQMCKRNFCTVLMNAIALIVNECLVMIE
jgi:hypothetical protein